MLVPVLLLVSLSSTAQIAINFNPAVHGQSVEGLSFVQLHNNSTEEVQVTLLIKVREQAAGDILTARLVMVPLRPGSNYIDRAAFSRAVFSFANNNTARTVSMSGRFPEGEYEYCFEAEVTRSKSAWVNPFFENCFIQHLQPMTPLVLINPADGDEACNVRPVFTWQLPFPLPADARCRMVLTEIKEKQDIAEAISYNMPLINQGNIQGNQLLFPAGTPSLLEDKKYAWQVIVYSGTTILKRSEIWEYHVKCGKETQQTSADSYRDLKENRDGDFYVANKFLRFSFQNPYSTGTLNYTITALSNPSEIIKGLPKMVMLPGLNKYDLDLTENKNFKEGLEYQLTIRLIDNRILQLRFIYQNSL